MYTRRVCKFRQSLSGKSTDVPSAVPRLTFSSDHVLAYIGLHNRVKSRYGTLLAAASFAGQAFAECVWQTGEAVRPEKKQIHHPRAPRALTSRPTFFPVFFVNPSADRAKTKHNFTTLASGTTSSCPSVASVGLANFIFRQRYGCTYLHHHHHLY